MKLAENNESLAENKILILYILNKMHRPIPNNVLYNLIITVLDMNYFYYQQFLLDLIESKYVTTFEKDSKKLYEITEKGQETLKLTQDLLPGILKLKFDTTFKDQLKQAKDKESIIAEFTPINENSYIVSCKINENGNNIFEVKVLASSREQAKNIVDNWKNNAESYYPKILDLLLNKGNEKMDE